MNRIDRQTYESFSVDFELAVGCLSMRISVKPSRRLPTHRRGLDGIESQNNPTLAEKILRDFETAVLNLSNHRELKAADEKVQSERVIF